MALQIIVRTLAFSRSESFLLDSVGLSILTFSIFLHLINSSSHLTLASITLSNPYYHSIETVLRSLVTILSASIIKWIFFSPHLYGLSAIYCVDHCLPLAAPSLPGSHRSLAFLPPVWVLLLYSFAGSSLLPSNWLSQFLKALTFAHSSFNPINSFQAFVFHLSYLCFSFSCLCRSQ